MSFRSAPPAAPRIPEERLDKTYKTWRFNVFMGIFLGYAAFYLIRNNVSLVSAILKEHGLMNAVGIGIVANAVLFAYGLSKFFMAMLSDRSNARYFMPLGLALSAVMNLFIASVPGITGIHYPVRHPHVHQRVVPRHGLASVWPRACALVLHQ